MESARNVDLDPENALFYSMKMKNSKNMCRFRSRCIPGLVLLPKIFFILKMKNPDVQIAHRELSQENLAYI